MDFERCLPNDSKLDSYFELDMDIFMHEIDELKSSQASGDILDEEAEFSPVERALYMDSLADYLLEGYIDDRSSEGNPSATHDAIYRAAIFAYQIACEVYGDETECDPYDYLMNLVASCSDAKERFEQGVQEYLAENPHVDAFIGMYADTLDQGRNQLPAIELTAGLIFMMVERRMGEIFVAEQTAIIEPSDFEVGER